VWRMARRQSRAGRKTDQSKSHKANRLPIPLRYRNELS
jgi:hypothetical protein